MTSKSASNALEVTVSELSGKLKRTVEDTFGHVRVRGEISGYRGPHSSGHSYFSLKDDRSRLEAVIWRGAASKLKHLPEEGLEVIASGKLTTYPGSSKYQIVIDQIEPAGAGALMALLEERRKKLTAEGLFEEGRKQLLPFMPKVIGVVTSPTGAVIRDILHRLMDRFPLHVIVWPVRVQGETSGPEVANGIRQLNELPVDDPLPRPDVIIVARGGGSLEDLWGFNDEIVVRAAAESHIPLISAVGHETDWTLIDHAADWRAPTPTAAAEKAVPVKADLEAMLADLGARLRNGMSRTLERNRSDMRSAARGLTSPDMLLAMPRRRFDEASGRLGRGLTNRVALASSSFSRTADRLSPTTLERRVKLGNDQLAQLGARGQRALLVHINQRRERFSAFSRRVRIEPIIEKTVRGNSELSRLGLQLSRRILALNTSRVERLERSRRLLETLSYKGVLARGFAVVRDEKGQPLTGISKIKPTQKLTVEMKDGSLDVVSGSKSEGKPVLREKTAKKTENQGDLF